MCKQVCGRSQDEHVGVTDERQKVFSACRKGMSVDN